MSISPLFDLKNRKAGVRWQPYTRPKLQKKGGALCINQVCWPLKGKGRGIADNRKWMAIVSFEPRARSIMIQFIFNYFGRWIMKKKIFVVVVLLLSVAMLTTGAFAWFSSTKTITGSQISAGTLNLGLNNDCGQTWGDTASAWSFVIWLRANLLSRTICMKNIGTIAAGSVWYDWANLLQNPIG